MARTQSQGNQLPPFNTTSEAIQGGGEIPKKRTISAAGRRRISQASKKRWQKVKAEGGGTKGQRGGTTRGNLEAFLEISWSQEELTAQLDKARTRVKKLEAMIAANQQPERTMSAGGTHYENS